MSSSADSHFHIFRALQLFGKYNANETRYLLKSMQKLCVLRLPIADQQSVLPGRKEVYQYLYIRISANEAGKVAVQTLWVVYAVHRVHLQLLRW